LQNPTYPIYLGRRACPPEGKLILGVRSDKGLKQALMEEPWMAQEWYKKKKSPVFLEIVRDAFEKEPATYIGRDNPFSFSQRHREYRARKIVRDRRAVRISNIESDLEIQTTHNPLDF